MRRLGRERQQELRVEDGLRHLRLVEQRARRGLDFVLLDGAVAVDVAELPPTHRPLDRVADGGALPQSGPCQPAAPAVRADQGERVGRGRPAGRERLGRRVDVPRYPLEPSIGRRASSRCRWSSPPTCAAARRERATTITDDCPGAARTARTTRRTVCRRSLDGLAGVQQDRVGVAGPVTQRGRRVARDVAVHLRHADRVVEDLQPLQVLPHTVMPNGCLGLRVGRVESSGSSGT